LNRHCLSQIIKSSLISSVDPLYISFLVLGCLVRCVVNSYSIYVCPGVSISISNYLLSYYLDYYCK